MATIAGGSISSISGGKFANGAVTAAMAYAFNQMQGKKNNSGASQDEESSTVCSDDACTGYLWKEIEPQMISGAPKPVWHGVDVIEDWVNLSPPLGKDLTGRMSSGLFGHYAGTETGHNTYPHVRRFQYIQYVDDRVNDSFTVHPVHGTDIRYGEVIWRPIQSDTAVLTRVRWKSCVSQNCFNPPLFFNAG